MIYAVLSNFDFVAKFTVKNLNKDFTNAVRGGGVTVLWIYFIKFRYFLKDGFPNVATAVSTAEPATTSSATKTPAEQIGSNLNSKEQVVEQWTLKSLFVC